MKKILSAYKNLLFLLSSHQIQKYGKFFVVVMGLWDNNSTFLSSQSQFPQNNLHLIWSSRFRILYIFLVFISTGLPGVHNFPPLSDLIVLLRIKKKIMKVFRFYWKNFKNFFFNFWIVLVLCFQRFPQLNFSLEKFRIQ